LLASGNCKCLSSIPTRFDLAPRSQNRDLGYINRETAVGNQRNRSALAFAISESRCFVTGHDFSRAANAEKKVGFSPCGHVPLGKNSCSDLLRPRCSELLRTSPKWSPSSKAMSGRLFRPLLSGVNRRTIRSVARICFRLASSSRSLLCAAVPLAKSCVELTEDEAMARLLLWSLMLKLCTYTSKT